MKVILLIRPKGRNNPEYSPGLVPTAAGLSATFLTPSRSRAKVFDREDPVDAVAYNEVLRCAFQSGAEVRCLKVSESFGVPDALIDEWPAPVEDADPWREVP